MKRSLQLKLILSFLVVALVTVLVASAIIRLTSSQSLMELVTEQQTAQLKESAQVYYAINGTLDGFFAYYLQSSPYQPGSSQPGEPSGPPPGDGMPSQARAPRGVYGMVDANYRALIPTFEYEIGQVVPADRIRQAVAVEVDGQTIAWILPDTGFQFKLSAEEQLFLQRTTLAIGLAALAGMLAAVFMGFLLSGRLLKPIRRLTQASQALARGDLQQQVEVASQDELGQLSATFNQMSADLLRADQQRKRMTADITHDLSTPLQIISGYMEMLEDGASLTPQRIDIIKTEIEHLRRLVSDLTTLSQVEAGGLEMQLQPVQPRLLLERLYQTYQPIAARQDVTLLLDAPAGAARQDQTPLFNTPAGSARQDETPLFNTPVSAASILVDEGRLLQVLKNLLDNALRHTPAGGQVSLRSVLSASAPALLSGIPSASASTSAPARVEILVSDTGSGIDPEDLPFVFERFYSADKARNASSGKMGLGLAICKALVEAMGGAITAESPGKGLGATIRLAFPAIK